MNMAATPTPLQKAAAVISSQAGRLAKLEELLRSWRCPIAILSAAARLPRANDIAGFSRLLLGGEDAIGEIPKERFNIDSYYDPNPEVPGKIYTRFGGFVDGVDEFDAPFFRISPVEARSMDPQQRLLLQTAWEGLEQAAIAAHSLRRSRTGVYVGVGPNEYGSLLADRGIQGVDAYFATGNSSASIAGRVAFVLGLQGPAVAFDTACSSSLVALHHACQGLRTGDCDLALAGGVSLLLSPQNMVAVCRARMLSADGRCKTFDKAADGYVRGEGCGLVVLKRLADAERDGDRVLAIIRGSAVNHDGTSSGFTVPNGPSQERVIADALEQAGVAPSEVVYLEAHGTGTSLGDPIEVQAASNVLGKGRSLDRPLLIGSVKTNIGHLEAAAGIAGVLKVVVALHHGVIPKSLHFHDPNPHIPWENLPVKVVTEPTAWPAGRRIAGVSSFGFSGTNAHFVLEGYSPQEATDTSSRSVASQSHEDPRERNAHVLALSACTEAALLSLAERYGTWLAEHRIEDSDLADLCFTAGAGRSHFSHRVAVVVKSSEQLAEAVLKLACGVTAANVCSGTVTKKPSVAVLFTGQGSQYAGMAKALYLTQPVFKSTLDRCASLLQGLRDEPLLDVLFEGDGARLNHTRWAQPALFSIEVSLYEMYRSLGVEAHAVLGHSVGEYSAAYAAGVLSLDDGLRLIAKRGELFGELPEGGAMAAIFAPGESIDAAVRRVNADPREIGVSIAALNGTHRVISGPTGLVNRVIEEFELKGVHCSRLATSHAFHSALLEPVMNAFEQFAETIEYREPERTLISNVTGKPVRCGETLDAPYWRLHARVPAQFEYSVAALARAGIDVLLELGPHPTLTTMALKCWTGDTPPAAIAALKRGISADEAFIMSIAALYAAGCEIDFSALDAGHCRRKFDLPSYPFQGQRYWHDPVQASVRSAPAIKDDYPFPGRMLQLAGVDDEWRFETTMHPDTPSFVADHQVEGVCVLPASGMVELAAAAFAQVDGMSKIALENLMIQKALVLEAGQRRVVQTIIGADRDASRPVQIYSRSFDEEVQEGWVLHASGALRRMALHASSHVALSDLRARIHNPVDVETHYRRIRRHGVEHGPAFRVITGLWVDQSSGEALGRLDFSPATSQDSAELWTVLVDACMQTLSAAAPDADGGGLWLPVALGQFSSDRNAIGTQTFWCHGLLLPNVAGDGAGIKADAWVSNSDGEILAELKNVQLIRTRGEAVRASLVTPSSRLFYELAWQRQAIVGDSISASAGEHWLLLCDKGGIGVQLAQRLRRNPADTVSTAIPAGTYRALGGGEYELDSEQPEQVRSWIAAAYAERAPTQVVHLASLDSATAATSLEQLISDCRRSCSSALHVVQALVHANQGPNWPRLTFVTRGAMAVLERDVPSLAPAPLWGLANVLPSEHPELRCLRLDLDPGEHGDWECLLEALRAQDSEDRVAYRGKERLVARLRRARGVLSNARPFALRENATYLITGGLGDLGLAVASWLVEQGARNLLLLGRSVPSPKALRGLDVLQRAGARVVTMPVDVACREALLNAFETAYATLPPIRGIFHAAGVLDDGVIAQQTWERFAAVMAPKVRGAWLLDELTQSLELDFFISFSSAASILGSPGQSNYAAANAFLDAMAHRQHRAGRSATSINWAAWSGLGMAGRTDIERRASAMGLRGLSSQVALDALGIAMRSTPPQVMVAEMDWRQLVRQYAAPTAPWLEELASEGEPNGGVGLSASATLSEIKRASPHEMGPLVETYLRQSIGRIMGLELDANWRTQSLTALGIDSLMALDLKKRIGSDLGVDVPVHRFIGEASIATISELLVERMRLSEVVADPRVAGEPSEDREVFTL